MKRLLWPLRPVLLPVWGRIRPLIEPSGRTPSPALLGRAKLAALAADAGHTPGKSWIRPLTKAEFDVLAVRFPYYRSRWEYMGQAASIADELIHRDHLDSALELGPHVRSVIVGADVMDRTAWPELEAEGRLILQDAGIVPWPMTDKQYGLFVALQVFEHLGTAQEVAFREVCRVARHAIISLPIDWVTEDPRNVHNGITNEKALSWFAPVVPTRVLVGNPGPKKRLIYVFEDLVPAAQA